jgi:hypothetical protein
MKCINGLLVFIIISGTAQAFSYYILPENIVAGDSVTVELHEIFGGTGNFLPDNSNHTMEEDTLIVNTEAYFCGYNGEMCLMIVTYDDINFKWHMPDPGKYYLTINYKSYRPIGNINDTTYIDSFYVVNDLDIIDVRPGHYKTTGYKENSVFDICGQWAIEGVTRKSGVYLEIMNGKVGKRVIVK